MCERYLGNRSKLRTTEGNQTIGTRANLKVVPIYKKDDAEKFSNYRPVSLLPCLSKILERLVFNRCVEYIDVHEILNEKQFGFGPNHST